MNRLTARSPKNGMAYLINVKQNEQDVESPYPNTLRCIMDSFNRLAAYEDSELSPEQVQELAKAEAEGRLVVLPCKVGQNCFVAIHTEKRVLEITVNEFSYSTWHGAWLITSTNECQYWLDNAYYTREAAEKALEVRE